MKIKVFIIIITFVTICSMLSLASCTYFESTYSLDDYLTTNVPLTYSEYVLFPDNKFLTMDVVNCYQSETITSLFFDDVYFLLNCTYTESDYQKELIRMQECSAEYRDDIFLYPAYVMLCYGNYYEYALLDSQTNTIIYISAETANFDYFKNFPPNYQPFDGNKIDICRYDTGMEKAGSGSFVP